MNNYRENGIQIPIQPLRDVHEQRNVEIVGVYSKHAMICTAPHIIVQT